MRAGNRPHREVKKESRAPKTEAVRPQTKQQVRTENPEESAPRRERTEGCPAGLSKRQCGEVAAATPDGKSSSQPVKAGECPPALSQAACEEAGEISAGAEKRPEVQPGECPPALPESQCAEVKKASEEAAR